MNSLTAALCGSGNTYTASIFSRMGCGMLLDADAGDVAGDAGVDVGVLERQGDLAALAFRGQAPGDRLRRRRPSAVPLGARDHPQFLPRVEPGRPAVSARCLAGPAAAGAAARKRAPPPPPPLAKYVVLVFDRSSVRAGRYLPAGRRDSLRCGVRRIMRCGRWWVVLLRGVTPQACRPARNPTVATRMSETSRRRVMRGLLLRVRVGRWRGSACRRHWPRPAG